MLNRTAQPITAQPTAPAEAHRPQAVRLPMRPPTWQDILAQVAPHHQATLAAALWRGTQQK